MYIHITKKTFTRLQLQKGIGVTKKEESKHKKFSRPGQHTHTTQMVLKIVPCNLEKSHSEWGNAVSVLTWLEYNNNVIENIKVNHQHHISISMLYKKLTKWNLLKILLIFMCSRAVLWWRKWAWYNDDMIENIKVNHQYHIFLSMHCKKLTKIN